MKLTDLQRTVDGLNRDVKGIKCVYMYHIDICMFHRYVCVHSNLYHMYIYLYVYDLQRTVDGLNRDIQGIICVHMCMIMNTCIHICVYIHMYTSVHEVD
jgi:hypothetical protein